MMVWIRKDDAPSVMPWNLRYDPVVKEARTGQGVLPPHYRPASNDDVPPGRMCGNCAYFDEGTCTLYAARCDADWYCDSWEPAEGVMVKHLAGTEFDHDQSVHGGGGGTGGTAAGGAVDADSLSRAPGSGIGDVIAGESAGSVVQQMLADGGISITFTGKKPETGYMVAVEGTEVVVDDATMRSEAGRQIVRDHIRKHAAMIREGKGTKGKVVSFTDQPKNYFGAWHNKVTPQNPNGDNKWYLDISENIGSLTDAVRVGRERSQIAIWDVRGSQGISMDSMFADYAMSREGGNPDGQSWFSLRERARRRGATASDALKAADWSNGA
jgi:hypothetical protein